MDLSRSRKRKFGELYDKNIITKTPNIALELKKLNIRLSNIETKIEQLNEKQQTILNYFEPEKYEEKECEYNYFS
tara:strand:- start:1591 stop:1815 length:225 start_codon:yes stop_codon:yes gene_type:complete